MDKQGVSDSMIAAAQEDVKFLCDRADKINKDVPMLIPAITPGKTVVYVTQILTSPQNAGAMMLGWVDAWLTNDYRVTLDGGTRFLRAKMQAHRAELYAFVVKHLGRH